MFFSSKKKEQPAAPIIAKKPQSASAGAAPVAPHRRHNSGINPTAIPSAAEAAAQHEQKAAASRPPLPPAPKPTSAPPKPPPARTEPPEAAYEPGLAPVVFRAAKSQSTDEHRPSGSSTFGSLKEFDIKGLSLPALACVQVSQRSLTVQRNVAGDFGFSIRRVQYPVAGSTSGELRTVVFVEPTDCRPGPPRPDDIHGLLPGDELIEVQGKSISRLSRDELQDVVRNCGDAINLVVRAVPELAEFCARQRGIGHAARNGEDALLLASNVDTTVHEAIPEDARVWLLHKGGYTLARLVERLPDGRAKITVAGRDMTVDATDVDRSNAPSLDRVGDVTALRYLNETSVVHLLRQRFHSGLAYTNAGSCSVICLAEDDNEGATVAHANEKLISMFKGCRRAQMPAHIFATAQHIYRTVQTTATSQSVLLSGVSGAGKSSQMRLLTRYFTVAAGWTKTLTYDRLACAFGVLEAMGNAATHLNRDSSRFMLLLQLGFDKAAALKSARFACSLLEAERVLTRPEGESNFHVFYYLWEGADDQLRSRLRLDSIETPTPLIKPLHSGEDRDHAREAWRRLLSALGDLGASASQIEGVCSTLGAIFHLARAEATAGAAIKAHFLRAAHAQAAADLLGVSVDNLAAAVFRGRGASTGAGAAAPSINRYALSNRAIDGPEALRIFTAALYQELFHAVVEVINRALAGGAPPCTFVNILDQPGSTFSADWLPDAARRRTSFGLSDLVFNYVNERVAEHFHDSCFAELQDLYSREQVEVHVEPPIGAPHPLTRLLDQKQQLLNSVDIERRAAERRGLLAIVEEESLFPGATDDSLAERIFVHLGDEAKLIRRGSTRLQFNLLHAHGASPTTYDVTGWSRAAGQSDVAAAARPLLFGTKSSAISSLFTPALSAAKKSAAVTSSTALLDSSRLRRMTQSAQLDGAIRRTATPGSMLGALAAQTDYVFSNLRRSARSHFIHCIQSSTGPRYSSSSRSSSSGISSSVTSPSPSLSSPSSCASSVLDVPYVRNQMRGTLLIDAIRAANRGYPERLSFRDFRRRFECLIVTTTTMNGGSTTASSLDASFSDALDDRSAVQKILERMDVHESRYRLGISQVLLQTDVLADLDERRELSLSGLIVSFQRACRHHLAAKWLQKRRVLETAVRCIQKNGRSYLGVREWPWWRLYTRVVPLLSVTRADAEQREWEERVARLEKQLNELRLVKARLEGRVAELTEEVQREAAGAGELSQALDRETQARLHVERRLQAAGDEEKRMSRVSSAAKMEAAPVDDAAVVILRKELATAKESEEALRVRTQRTVGQLHELQSELEALRATNATLEKKQSRFDSEFRTLQKTLEEHKEQAERVAREKEEALATATRRAAESKEARDESSELRMQLSRLRREADEGAVAAAVQGGTDNVESLLKQKRQFEAKIHDLEDELDDLTGQNQMLQQQVTRLEMNAERLRGDVKREAEGREAECDELRATYQRRLRAFEEQVADLTEANQSLSKQNRLLEVRARQHDVSQSSLSLSAGGGNHYKRELRRALALLADTEAILAHERESAAGPQALLKHLRQQLEDSEAAKLAALKSRHGLESELSELRTQLEQSAAARKVAEERAMALLREKNGGLALIEEKDEQMQALLKKYKQAVQQHHLDGIAIADNIEQIAELQKAKQKLTDELNERTAQMEYLHQHTVEKHRMLLLEQKLKELQARLDLETTQRQRLESMVANKTEETEALREQLADSATAREREAEQTRKTRREVGLLTETIEELRKRETELIHRSKTAKQEHEELEESLRATTSDLRAVERRCETMRHVLADGLDRALDEESSDDEELDEDLRVRSRLMTPLATSSSHRPSSTNGVRRSSSRGSARTVASSSNGGGARASKKEEEEEATAHGMNIL